MSQKKQSVSVRLSESDVRKVKDISKRLGVKDSELFRFIVKNTLAKLLPFQNEGVKGIDLIPALVDCGGDLTRYLDIDTDALDEIVNAGVHEPHKKIDKADLDMLALASVGASYVSYKLSELKNQPVDEASLEDSLKEYLYGKYLGGDLVVDQGSRGGDVKKSVVSITTTNDLTQSKGKHYANF
ncbi:MAG: hypothetical protein MI976_19490 [Pseudomonadales bacterium]|nr:hypothetical protein [Pseudomonadales bacterium]